MSYLIAYLAIVAVIAVYTLRRTCRTCPYDKHWCVGTCKEFNHGLK